MEREIGIFYLNSGNNHFGSIKLQIQIVNNAKQWFQQSKITI
jgi:hypothetical protein